MSNPGPWCIIRRHCGIEIEDTIPGTGQRITLPRVEPGNAEAAASPLDHWAARGDVDQQAETSTLSQPDNCPMDGVHFTPS